MQIWRTRQPKQASTNWKRSGIGKSVRKEKDVAEGDDSIYIKVVICFKTPQLQAAIVQEVFRRGGVLKTGAAPLSPGEREVKKLLANLGKK